MITTPVTLHRIVAALHISPDDYIDHFYNSGHDYLTKRHDETLLLLGGETSKQKRRQLRIFTNAFLFSPVFWFWWRAETEKVDRAFLRSNSSSKTMYNKLQTCRLLVPPENVIDEIIETSTVKQPVL